MDSLGGYSQWTLRPAFDKTGVIKKHPCGNTETTFKPGIVNNSGLSIGSASGDRIMVQAPADGMYSMTFYSLTGKAEFAVCKVLRRGINAVPIRKDIVGSGMHIICVAGEGKKIVGKETVIR